MEKQLNLSLVENIWGKFTHSAFGLIMDGVKLGDTGKFSAPVAGNFKFNLFFDISTIFVFLLFCGKNE